MRKFLVFLLVMTAFFFFTATYKSPNSNETQWLLKSSPSFAKNISSNDVIPKWLTEKNYSVLASYKELGTEGRTLKDHGWKSLVLITDLIVLIGWPIYLAYLIILVFRELMTRLFKRKR